MAAWQISQLHQHHHAAPRQPASWPHQVGIIPSRAHCFQDRAEVARLRQTLAGGGIAVVESAGGQLSSGVLAGMGGVGKTQLAADYARTTWQAEDVDVLVWITASNTTAAVSGYAQAGIEVLGADPGDPQQAAQAFLAWLEPKAGQRSCRWLVVLDDVTNPADLNGLWPPVSPHGRTLITTRRKDAALTGNGRHLIEVGLFTAAQSMAYLTATLAARHRTEPEQQLAALADELGHLPLALSQAAAYLIDTGLGCATYRALLVDQAGTLTDAAPDILPDSQIHTVAAAWTLSIDHADTLRPAGLALPLLQLAAFLDPNGIPDTVLTSAPALTYLTDHAAARRVGQIAADQAVLALRALYRLSLIDHTPDTPHQAVRIHQLLQHAVRDTLNAAQHHQLARTAADALVAAWPETESDTALAQILRANTTALTDHAEEALHRPEAHRILYRAGNSLGDTGQFEAAVRYFEHLVDTCRRYLGPGHPSTLAARYQLGDWQGEHGQYGDGFEAVDTLEALLTDMIPLLGPDHPDTLNTRRLLANCRAKTEGPHAAFAELKRLLDDMVRVLGHDHPRTLTTRRLLAGWQGTTGVGDLAEAIDAHERLLPDLERVLGPDHLDTLTVRNELAYQRGQHGQPLEAEAMLEELVPHMVRVLGPTNLYTLKARNQLAHWQAAAGHIHGAVDTYEELLDDLERVYGPDHPHSKVVQDSLHYWNSQLMPLWARDDWFF